MESFLPWDAMALPSSVVPVRAGSRLFPRIVKKLARQMTWIVLLWNNERPCKEFSLKNGIKNPWVVIFNLAVVPNNRADAINNPADVPKDPADDPDIRRLP